MKRVVVILVILGFLAIASAATVVAFPQIVRWIVVTQLEAIRNHRQTPEAIGGLAVRASPTGSASGDNLLRLGLGLAILALVTAAGACRTAGDPYRDASIEAEVKARLVGEQDANLTRLGVVSSDGTVYLSGAVPSPEQKARAETVAKGVTGVRKIVNTLDVRPATPE